MIKENDFRKKILLVDDDEIHLEITELALKDEYAVFMVKSGEEALEFLGKNHITPDLIMLDIQLPSMDGWVIFDKIQDITALEYTPILFYTSLDEERARERAYELGAFDYITKPCDQSILLRKIRETLNDVELRRQHYSA